MGGEMVLCIPLTQLLQAITGGSVHGIVVKTPTRDLPEPVESIQMLLT